MHFRPQPTELEPSNAADIDTVPHPPRHFPNQLCKHHRLCIFEFVADCETLITSTIGWMLSNTQVTRGREGETACNTSSLAILKSNNWRVWKTILRERDARRVTIRGER